MHSSLRLSAAALTTYFLPFSYDLLNCSVQPSERKTQQFCLKRVCSSFVGGFMAGQRNESRVGERGRQAALPRFRQDAQVPRAKPCCISLLLPLYSPRSTMYLQTILLPAIGGLPVKTTLFCWLQRSPILSKIKIHWRESSLQYTLYLIIQNTA